MLTTIKLLKTEGEALGAYLLLREGLALNHNSCLCAVAVAHGHKDWNAVTALGASADVPLREHADIAAQGARVAKYLSQRYGVTVEDAVGAVAAMRWGALVEAANEAFGDPGTACKWLHASHPALGGVAIDELVDTDEGYAQVERLLMEMV
jgi:hypothetical protein